jgi:MFS family permease
LRFFIWYRFLWQVSRLNLNLIASHPDRAAGLAFVGSSAYAFGPIVFAQGAMLAGLIASRVLYRSDNLFSFKFQAGGFVVFFVLAILGPLLMFTPKMARARRKGLADYGLLAQRYVESFEQKWIAKEPTPSEELLGSGDIQSLADLGNSFAVVREMRVVPFGLQDITRLAATTAAPMVPLLLTVWTPEEVILRILKVVF